MGLLTKERLKAILLNVGSYEDENAAISFWVDSWAEYFEVAMAEGSSDDPSYVTIDGSFLKIGVNSILGTSDLSGTEIVVTCNITGSSETIVSEFDTENFVKTTDYLGQSAPSTNVSDYIVTFPSILFDDSSIDILKNALSNELRNLSESDKGAEKLQKGLEAWWEKISDSPSTFFSSAIGITIPPNLSNLEDTLQDTFDENSSSVPPLTTEEDVDPVSEDLNNATIGGKLLVGIISYDIV